MQTQQFLDNNRITEIANGLRALSRLMRDRMKESTDPDENRAIKNLPQDIAEQSIKVLFNSPSRPVLKNVFQERVRGYLEAEKSVLEAAGFVAQQDGQAIEWLQNDAGEGELRVRLTMTHADTQENVTVMVCATEQGGRFFPAKTEVVVGIGENLSTKDSIASTGELAATILDAAIAFRDRQSLNDTPSTSSGKEAEHMELAQHARDLGVTLEQLQAEYDAVAARYKDTPQWMKAPNGEPTKLTERQWVLVRTPRFKAWFGNWEMQRDKELPVIEVAERIFDGDRKAAQEWLTDKAHGIVGTHGNDETRMQIAVSAGVLKGKSTSGAAQDKSKGKAGTAEDRQRRAVDHYEVMRQLPSLLKHASLVAAEAEKNNDRNVLGVYKFVVLARVDSVDYAVKLTVKDHAQGRGEGSRFYTHELVDIEIGMPTHNITANEGEPARAMKGAGIAYSVGELVDAVNRADAGAIPGASQVIDPETGEPRVVYRGTPEKMGNTFEYGQNFYGGNKGFWFTTAKSAAKDYAFNEVTGETGEIKEVFLSARDVLDLTPLGINTTSKRFCDFIRETTGIDLGRGSSKEFRVNELYEKHQSLLYPGKHHAIKMADVGHTYIVKLSNQIKSATHNIGTYSERDNDIRFQAAWHGTLYEFEQFSLDHIGSGQGAQVHGWGLYFARGREIAESYRRLAEDGYEAYIWDGERIEGGYQTDSWVSEYGEDYPRKTPRGQALWALSDANGDKDEALFLLEAERERIRREAEDAVHAEIGKTAEEAAAEQQWNAVLDGDDTDALEAAAENLYEARRKAEEHPAFAQRLQELLTEDAHYKLLGEAADALRAADVEATEPGRIYAVDLPDDHELMRKDAPLIEQPLQVRERLTQMYEAMAATTDDNRRGHAEAMLAVLRGEGETATFTAYAMYNNLALVLGNEEDASRALGAAGIPGWSYEGTLDGECFVIWNDAAIRVMDTQYKRLSAEEMAAQGAFEFDAPPPAPISEEHQAAVDTLNRRLALNMGEAWENAYAPTTLPPGLADVADAMKAAFGRTVRPIVPTSNDGMAFGGVYISDRPGEVFVNIRNNSGFIQLAGHELLHELQHSRPDLYKWFVKEADSYLVNVEEYRERRNLLGKATGEGHYDLTQAKNEILADFAGDTLADEQFLGQLAKSNSKRFGGLLTTATKWLDKVKGKLLGLQSSQYVTEVDALRDKLAAALMAYATNKSIEEVLNTAPEPAPEEQPQEETVEWLRQQYTLVGREYWGHMTQVARLGVLQVLYKDELTPEQKIHIAQQPGESIKPEVAYFCGGYLPIDATVEQLNNPKISALGAQVLQEYQAALQAAQAPEEARRATCVATENDGRWGLTITTAGQQYQHVGAGYGWSQDEAQAAAAALERGDADTLERYGVALKGENLVELFSYTTDREHWTVQYNKDILRVGEDGIFASLGSREAAIASARELLEHGQTQYGYILPEGGLPAAAEVQVNDGRIEDFGEKLGRERKANREVFPWIHSDEGQAELRAAWEDVKTRDNVKKEDVRGTENRLREGKDWRNGQDATPEMFTEAFGFRGVEFGNWVKQGKDDRERQWMLNQAYDAFHDLADVLGVPTKALSLNGSLGIGFGSRGRGGRAAAHFEPDLVVINLTKTQGAGSLAHEWFHALDNYFSRMRNNERGYITERPEAVSYVHKDELGQPYPWRKHRSELEKLWKNPGYRDYRDPEYYNPENWVPVSEIAVRPEIEVAFARLVEALDNSPMAKRANLNDKGRKEYWGKTIERAARAFENYVIAKLDERGHHNDYLANVVPPGVFVRAAERYPYLKPEEMPPVKEAFDNLFATAQTRETDKGVALFSRQQSLDYPPAWDWQTDYTIAQKVKGATRRVAHFQAQVERFADPQTPREKAALTLSSRKLREAQRELERITNYRALREQRKQAPDKETLMENREDDWLEGVTLPEKAVPLPEEPARVKFPGHFAAVDGDGSRYFENAHEALSFVEQEQLASFGYTASDKLHYPVHKIDGQWWVRGLSSYGMPPEARAELPVQEDDKPLAEAQAEIEHTALANIELRHQMRVRGELKGFRLSWGSGGEPTEKPLIEQQQGVEDAGDFMFIADPELQRRAIELMADNMNMPGGSGMYRLGVQYQNSHLEYLVAEQMRANMAAEQTMEENNMQDRDQQPPKRPWIDRADEAVAQQLRAAYEAKEYPEKFVVEGTYAHDKPVELPGTWDGEARIFADDVENTEAYGVYVQERYSHGFTKVADFLGDAGLQDARLLAHRLNVIGAVASDNPSYQELRFRQLRAEQTALDNIGEEPLVEQPEMSADDWRVAGIFRRRDTQNLVMTRSSDDELFLMQQSALNLRIDIGDGLWLPGDWMTDPVTANVKAWMDANGELHEDPQTWEVRVERYAHEDTELIASFSGEDAQSRAEALAERLSVIAAYADIDPIKQRERFAQLAERQTARQTAADELKDVAQQDAEHIYVLADHDPQSNEIRVYKKGDIQRRTLKTWAVPDGDTPEAFVMREVFPWNRSAEGQAELRAAWEAVKNAMPPDWDGGELDVQASVIMTAWDNKKHIMPAAQFGMEPEVWGVYATLKDGKSVCLESFATRAEAERAVWQQPLNQVQSTGEFALPGGYSTEDVQYARETAQSEGVTRFLYSMDSTPYDEDEIDGQRIKQVDLIDGQWWVRGQLTPDQSTPPTTADMPLVELEAHINRIALRNIEVRQEQRAALPADEPDFRKAENAEHRDRKMAQDDSRELHLITDPEMRARAAAVMVANAQQYPAYLKEIEFSNPNNLKRLETFAATEPRELGQFRACDGNQGWLMASDAVGWTEDWGRDYSVPATRAPVMGLTEERGARFLYVEPNGEERPVDKIGNQWWVRGDKTTSPDARIQPGDEALYFMQQRIDLIALRNIEIRHQQRARGELTMSAIEHARADILDLNHIEPGQTRQQGDDLVQSNLAASDEYKRGWDEAMAYAEPRNEKGEWFEVHSPADPKPDAPAPTVMFSRQDISEQPQPVKLPDDWSGKPLEVAARVLVKDGDDDIGNVLPAEHHPDIEPVFWGVYARLQDGTCEWLEDFDTQEDAQRFAQRLYESQPMQARLHDQSQGDPRPSTTQGEITMKKPAAPQPAKPKMEQEDGSSICVFRGFKTKLADGSEYPAILVLKKPNEDFFRCTFVDTNGKKQSCLAFLNHRNDDPNVKFFTLSTKDKNGNTHDYGYGNVINRRSDGKQVFFDQAVFNINGSVSGNGQDMTITAFVGSKVDAALHKNLGFEQDRIQRPDPANKVADAPKPEAPSVKDEATDAPQKQARRRTAAPAPAMA